MFWGEYPANQSPGLCRLDDILSCYNKIIILLYQDKYNKINKLFKQDNKLFKQDKKEKKNVPSRVPYVVAHFYKLLFIVK